MRRTLHRIRWYMVAVAAVCVAAGVTLLLWPNPSPGDRLPAAEQNAVSEDAPMADDMKSGTEPSGPEAPLAETVFVILRPGADPIALAARQGLAPGSITPIGATGTATITVPNGMTRETLARSLSQDPEVETVAGDEIVRPAKDPSDNDMGKQWGLKAIHPEVPWDNEKVRRNDPALTLAVIDTGVDTGHEDLTPAVTADDVSKPHSDSCGHGTHVAGIAAAITDNGIGIASPAWSQPVLDLAAIADDNCKSPHVKSPSARLATVLDYIGYSKNDHQCDSSSARRAVVNNSWVVLESSDPLVPQTRVMDKANAELLRTGFDCGQVVWVFSAGNYASVSDDVSFPAKAPYVISVGAVKEGKNDLKRADFSQEGAPLDVVAPGVGIYSTFPGPGKYGPMSGTSMAAPFVSGVATALWKAEPLLTGQQVMKRIMASGGRGSHDNGLGYGVVDMQRAFSLDTTPPTVEISRLDTKPGEPLKFRIRAHDDLETHGLAPIDETIDTIDANKSRGTDHFRLDFAEVPTSAVDAIRYSVDGGPWQDLSIPHDGIQHTRRDPDGFLCQVCTEFTVPVPDLGLVPEHRIVVRAWDSSAKPDDAKFNEVQITFRTEAASARAQGSTTVLVMDTSGSMDDAFGPAKKIDAAKAAALDVADMVDQTESLGGANRLGLIAFADSPTVKAAPEPKADRAKDEISRLTPSGSTDIGAALQVGISTASGGSGSRSLILLSDGLPTSGLDKQGIMAGPVAQAKREGIPIYTVLLGTPNESDAAFLQSIAAATAGDFSVADTPNALKTQFLKAEHRTSGQIIAEEVAPEIPLDVPRYAGILRVSALASDGSIPTVVLTSPGGTDLEGNVELGNTGTEAATTITVPDPSAGRWTARASSPVLFIVSAQPRPAPPALADLNPPRDLSPPSISLVALPVPSGPTQGWLNPAGWTFLGVAALIGTLGLLGMILPVPESDAGLRSPTFAQRHRRGVLAAIACMVCAGLIVAAIVLVAQGLPLGVDADQLGPLETAAGAPAAAPETQHISVVRVKTADRCLSVRADPDPDATERACVAPGLLLGFAGESRNGTDGTAWAHVNDPASDNWGWVPQQGLEP